MQHIQFIAWNVSFLEANAQKWPNPYQSLIGWVCEVQRG